MRLNRIFISVIFVLKMLFRRGIVITLFIIIPLVFFNVVDLTTSERILPFLLGSMAEEVIIEVSEREISMVFFAVATAGFLSSFLALNLVQKNYRANRRLVICGYRSLELLTSNLVSLIISIVIISIYISLLSTFFVDIQHLMYFTTGLILSGLVYGLYGMLIGSLIKGELEGILSIVLLVNIDAGWLQNPLFYAESQQQNVIKYLPAFHPSQFTVKSAFTNFELGNSALYSLLYGLVFLIISILIFHHKIKLEK